MNKYLDIWLKSTVSYGKYLWHDITHPSLHSYFYFLIALSLVVWLLEIVWPWRKTQKTIRNDFWFDGVYMFFNLFIFSLIGYHGFTHSLNVLFNDILSSIGIQNHVLITLQSWPEWIQIFIYFILVDFIQWLVHNALHRNDWLWNFHKMHHSVTEMGFAAHLRYHWMENVFYQFALFITLSWIGFNIDHFFIIHTTTLLIGHLNHANINWSYGPLKYILNSPRMHIWHHAKDLPKEHPKGMNFGISLSIWDYIFKTAYIPYSGKSIALGFPAIERYRKHLFRESIWPTDEHKEK